MNDSEAFGTFWDHVEDLRWTLIRSLVIIAFGVGCTLFFYDKVFQILTLPLEKIQTVEGSLHRYSLKRERILNTGSTEITYLNSYTIPPGGYIDIDVQQPVNQLVIFGPVEGFVTTLKTAFWVGLVGSSPFWLWQVFQFIAPALTGVQRRMILPFFALSIVFMLTGMLFAFFVTLPLANQYLYAFNSEIGVNIWSLANYLNYTVVLLLANALAFELAVIAFFLVKLGVLSAQGLSSYRRHAIVGAFVLAALLTPPDVLTQFLLAIPIIILYEFIIFYARLRSRFL